MKKYCTLMWEGIILFSLLLSSCGRGQILEPTPNPTSTSVPTSTFTPTSTSTSTPEPTFTPTFTSTPTCVYYPGLPCYEGSYYEIGRANPAVNWDGAVALANSKEIYVCKSAHLATITTAEEQAVISDLMKGVMETAWIGGFQPANELRIDEGWEWITGEEFTYTYWNPGPSGEPNDSPYGSYIQGSEQTIEIYPSGRWNDAPKKEAKKYYIVEYEDCY